MNIRKIIREEIEDDFGWARDIPPLAGGGLFPENDICFDEGDDCKVNINKDNIIFRIALDNDFYNEYSTYEDEWIMSDLFRTSMDEGGYDGDGDWYEFDEEEFNYTGYHLDDDLKKRIVDFWLKVNEGEDISRGEIEPFFNDYMLSFNDYLKSPTLISKFEGLIENVLNELGYAVQRNRWISTSNRFNSEIEKMRDSGVGIEVDRDYGLNDLVVTVPMEMVNKIYREYSFEDLESLFKKVMKPIFEDIYWYDWFHDEWDSSGATDEIVGLWERFLDDGEEFINSGEYKEEKKFIDFVYEKFYSNGWESKKNTRYYLNVFEKPYKNTPHSKWALNVNLNSFMINPKKAVLSGGLRNNLNDRWSDRLRYTVNRKENESVETYLDRFFNEIENLSQEYVKKYFK